MQPCPPERKDTASPTRTQAPIPSTRKPTKPTEPTPTTVGRHKNNGNYEPAAYEKEIPNSVKQNEKTEKYAAHEGARKKPTRPNK